MFNGRRSTYSDDQRNRQQNEKHISPNLFHCRGYSNIEEIQRRDSRVTIVEFRISIEMSKEKIVGGVRRMRFASVEELFRIFRF